MEDLKSHEDRVHLTQVLKSKHNKCLKTDEKIGTLTKHELCVHKETNQY